MIVKRAYTIIVVNSITVTKVYVATFDSRSNDQESVPVTLDP